jgi:hypothetical protein
MWGWTVSGSYWFYWREYYGINRSTWPEMSRRAAALDALKLAVRVKR